jgi:hypothetical protein
MQWPLTSQLHGSVSQTEQLVFHYGSNSMPLILIFKTPYAAIEGLIQQHYKRAGFYIESKEFLSF